MLQTVRPILAVLLFASISAFAEDVRAPRFESGVQPIFRAKCFACHDAKSHQASLSLETRDDLLKGGKSGSAVIAGKPVDSLLLTMVTSGKMPLGGEKLPPGELDTIRKWIEG